MQRRAPRGAPRRKNQLAKTARNAARRILPYTQARIRAPAFPTVRVRITAALLLAAVELRNIVETRAL
jgi:hypothetical protein